MLAILLVCAWIVGGGAPGPQEPAKHDPPAIRACSSCAGEGRLERDCWVCDGDGEHPCLACTRFTRQPAARWSITWVPQAVVEQLQASMAELARAAEALGDLDLSLALGGKRGPKATSRKPGELACAAQCRSGKLLLIEDWVDCKVCRGGKSRCGYCRKGELACAHCDGKGRAVEACDDCTGTGALPDPTSLSPQVCPWCLGKLLRSCGSCAPTQPASGRCTACLGRTELPCPTCRGAEVLPCERCGGRGRHGPRKTDCEVCGETGKRSCTTCEDGLVTCESCRSDPPPTPVACPHCRGAGEHLCNGCGAGGYAAWEEAASWLAARDERESGAAWLREARRRAERRYEEVLAKLDAKADPDPGLRRALKKEAAAELARLDEELEALLRPDGG